MSTETVTQAVSSTGSPLQMTPMIRQYLEIKEQHKDAILFFRLGDFYEMFMEDARIVSRECDLTLTGRGKDDQRIDMCGFPHHSAQPYIHKLIDRGYKVAICEQVEEATEGKGITRREVVQIITPGTVISSEMVEADENRYLLSVCQNKDQDYGISFVDCSTGEFKCAVVTNKEHLLQIIKKLDPKEILIDNSLDLALETTDLINPVPMHPVNRASEIMKDFFKVQSLSSFGLSDYETAFPAAASILDYIQVTQKQSLDYITTCLPQKLDQNMSLDQVTIRNLELFKPLYGTDNKGSLFWVLNHTKTTMGARQLKQWLANPLTDSKQINKRLDAVSVLKSDILSREEIRGQLNAIYDLERLLARVFSNQNNPRDLIGLKESLESCSELAPILSHLDCDLLNKMEGFFSEASSENGGFKQICALIDRAIVSPAPTTIAQGNVIKGGYDEALDELLRSFKDIKEWISSLEQVEQEKTGIKTLRVGFNKVFGYYFQVSKGQTDHVPEHYIRKQTLTHAERYITPELKEKETILLHGEEKQIQHEQELYKDLINTLKASIPFIQQCAYWISQLDCLQSLATTAQKNNYCRPTFTDEAQSLTLESSRHPVLEKQQPQKVISNDITLSPDSFIYLITGPNMAGKSTVMKQVALTTIMAQIGSFVSASNAKLSLFHHCFTRIGASDNLMDGQSTFMVEMTETATILHNADSRSLILLDEIGRGTSTYDGMSIAAAVLDYIHSSIRACTMFATHYHELTDITQTLRHCKNVSLAIDEVDGQLAFTYKIKNCPADKSYGIHVAEMAGLPQAVIDKASSLCDYYESQGNTQRPPDQLSLFNL